jgi:hypothetical protein
MRGSATRSERTWRLAATRGGAAALVGAVLALVPPAAAARQEPAETTRSGQLEAAREAKAADLTPPRRTLVERALYWYDNQHVLSRLFGGWHGFYGVGGQFPAGAGTAIGLAYVAGGERGFGLDAAVATSTRGYSRGSVAVGARQLGGSPVDVLLRAQGYEYPQEDFFGLGIDSQEGDRTNYLRSSVEGGTDVVWRPRPRFEVVTGVSYLSPRVGAGTDSRYPSTDVTFDPAGLPGYLDPADYLRADLGVSYDGRDAPLHPHAGGRYSARVSEFRDLDSAGFRRVDIDVQQYVPIPSRYRTLALRATGVFTDDRGGGDVPFYFQPTLGGASTLRGFREFRFQDRHAVALSAEYRWEAWWALDGAVFVDAGTVAPRLQSLSVRDVEVTYGVGLRLHGNRAFVARLDLARSREGFIPLLRFEHVF